MFYKDTLLRKVLKPGRYTGGEYGQCVKPLDGIKCRFAFAFPDTYEIGMSNLGVRILYTALNKNDDIYCERAYAPWVDMEQELIKYGIPLTSHETGTPLSEFDILGFTLQYEMCYTNVLNMLKLSKIPLYAKDRGEDMPIVIGGGPCAYNAEPVADFFDVFSIGEGEEALVEFSRLYIDMKEKGEYTREGFLYRVATELEGFYVPSLYTPVYNEDGTVRDYLTRDERVPKRVKKRIMPALDDAVYPETLVMPYIECVQDRITLEIARGCIRGCRFCQAGMLYRPIRERSAEKLNEIAKKLFLASGHSEISLSSLSVSDYSDLPCLTDKLLEWTDDCKVNISLPSLRADSFTKELMDKVSGVRTTTLTFAPEAGTQRLRDVINKNITKEEIMKACTVAFEAGKSAVKLYFMIGHPTETDEDIKGIADLAKDIIELFYSLPKRPEGKPRVTISVACFIPKPFTAFQWEGQNSIEEFERKQQYLRSCITDKKIKYDYHDAATSLIEAVLARGDRRLAPVIAEACNRGMRFDAWGEFFSFEKWKEVFSDLGVSMDFYAARERSEDEFLPWDIIDPGVTKKFLLREKKLSQEGKTTPACNEKCAGCGAFELGGECTWCPTARSE